MKKKYGYYVTLRPLRIFQYNQTQRTRFGFCTLVRMFCRLWCADVWFFSFNGMVESTNHRSSSMGREQECTNYDS